MFGIGWSEAFVIGLLALIFVPTEDLPRLARDLGRRYGQLRRQADELRRAFVLEADRQDAHQRFVELQERRKKLEAERLQRLAEVEAAGGVAQEPPPAAASPAVLAPEDDPETPAPRPAADAPGAAG
jgi:sec-independent protein translocase protein TatB